jgi:hypothetical protein
MSDGKEITRAGACASVCGSKCKSCSESIAGAWGSCQQAFHGERAKFHGPCGADVFGVGAIGRRSIGAWCADGCPTISKRHRHSKRIAGTSAGCNDHSPREPLAVLE